MKRVICLGSHQGADSVAWRLADALIAQSPAVMASDAAFEVLLCASPAQMIGLFANAEAIAIIDAVPQLPAGALRRLGVDELRQDSAWSSHGLDLVTVLKLTQALGDLPRRCVILGVGVGSEDADPRPIVAAVLPAVLEELVRL